MARGQLATVTAASSVGLLLEWYDFFVYGILAPTVLNKLFSPLQIRWRAFFWQFRAGPLASSCGPSARRSLAD